MVERPIKKSERQIVAEPSDVVEEVLETEASLSEGSPDSTTQAREKRIITLPLAGKDKAKGKGKGNKQDDERSSPANPALMRGPKPTRPKGPVIKPQSASAEDSATEPDQETTAEG